MDNRFSNTRELQRDGLRFFNEGYYTKAPQGTKDYYDYWEEQRDRCLNGYSVGNLSITGYHYFYLNFTQIDRAIKNELGGHEKKMGPPRFYDWDYDYFWSVDIARYGVSDTTYENLQLDVDIDDIDGGNHLAVIKGRRKGYSYKAASMLTRNFCMKRNSKNYAMASEKEFLLNDGLLSKTWDNLSFMENNTPFGQPKQIANTKMKKIAGYKENVNGIEVEKGRKNQISGVSLKDNPEKARGKGGELGFFEEAGKFPGLLKAWEVCRPSYEQGEYVTGTMIAYGTGGTEDADYEGLEEIFYNPSSYNVLPIKNQWDDGAEDNVCSFFVPAYTNLDGHIDKHGNSDKESAKQYLETQREKKQEADDPRAHSQYIAEFPFNPREATLQVDKNIFPTGELNSQLAKVISKNRQKILTAGKLLEQDDGSVSFHPHPEEKPIFKDPTPKNSDRSGAVVVKETPYRDKDNKVPNNLYMICHDPYAHDGSPDGSSLGAAYVIKRMNNFDLSYANCIVASYVGRPARQDDYNRNLFKLAKYYNAKIAFENDRGNVMEYAKNHRLLQYLYEKPDIQENKQRGRKSTTRAYGMSMNSRSTKNQGEVYIRDWLIDEYAKYEDGSSKMVLNTIVDPALLQELAKYNKDGNFDRVSALMIGMFYMRQLDKDRIVAKKDQQAHHDEFFNRNLFQ